MEQLVVIANLGRIRTLKFKKGGADPQEQDHLVEETGTTLEEAPGSRGEVVTDQSGRFARGGSAGTNGGMSYGEAHNLDSEMERKALERLASAIGEYVGGSGNPSWVLAAPKPILQRLQEALPQSSRATLSRTVGSDLTKTPVAKLEERFLAKK